MHARTNISLTDCEISPEDRIWKTDINFIIFSYIHSIFEIAGGRHMFHFVSRVEEIKANMFEDIKLGAWFWSRYILFNYSHIASHENIVEIHVVLKFVFDSISEFRNFIFSEIFPTQFSSNCIHFEFKLILSVSETVPCQ